MRALLIGRHFWPHGSIDAAGHLMDLATGLNTAGLNVSVMTPRYSSSWPEKLDFRELTVYRPVRIFRTGWTARGDRTATRYIRYVRDWIVSNPPSCDIIYCDGCREEAVAALDAGRSCGIPVVIRIAGNGSCSDLDYFTRSRMGRRCRLTAINADAVILGSAAAERRWLAECTPTKATHRIPVGVGPTLDQGLSSPRRLRRSLARINGDLHVPEHCSVVLSVERMRQDSGLMTLVQSADALSQNVDGLQFWLVGDGPSRDAIYTQIKGDGLRQTTAMPGSFGYDDDVFSAADLMVHVGDEGFEHQVPMAIAAGLPLVMANTETAREFFAASDIEVRERFIERRTDGADLPAYSESFRDDPGRLIWWFDPRRPKTLRFAIDQIVSNAEAARARSHQLRKLFQRTRPQSESINCYSRLFRQIVEDSIRASRGPMSMENAQ